MSSGRGAAAAPHSDPESCAFGVPPSISRAIHDDNSRASDIFICGATGKYSHGINGLYSKAFFKTELKGHDGRIVYGRALAAGNMCIMHHDGYWVMKPSSFKLSDGFFARVKGACALEACTAGVWQVHDEQGPGFHEQPAVKMFTGHSAVAEHINSVATDVYVSGLNSKIDGLFSPTQDRGRDGCMLYRKSGESGDQALCIEHFEGQWQVKNESDVGSCVCFAFVRGGCALESCRSRLWNGVYGENVVGRTGVDIVAGQQAKSKASSSIILAP